nr:MAG TPA: hypothetical protein [Caudoviricetes sp.]
MPDAGSPDDPYGAWTRAFGLRRGAPLGRAGGEGPKP